MTPFVKMFESGGIGAWWSACDRLSRPWHQALLTSLYRKLVRMGVLHPLAIRVEELEEENACLRKELAQARQAHQRMARMLGMPLDLQG